MAETQAGGQFMTGSVASEDTFIPEDFTREHKAIAKTVRDFVAGEIQSRGDDIEQVNNELSRELMEKAGELGLLSADIPEEYDGMALDKISSLIISDGLGQGAGSFTITELNHTGIGTLPLAFFGTQDQKEKYLAGLSTGKLIGAFGLTEPDAGSDALNARTTAVLSQDGRYYILNGTKAFITNAGFADLIFTFAKVDGTAFTAFIVEFASEGLTVDAEEVKMGMKGTSTRSVIFNNVKVPVENVLGEVGKGHVVALNALNMGRFKVGAVCVGNARGTFNEAVKYAVKRVQFGRPICDFGLISEKIAAMASRLFAGESMMYRTAHWMDRMIKTANPAPDAIGRVTAAALEEYLIECSIMKVFGSEMLGFVADESVQIFGGYGYIYENPAELSFRNARINRIWEGTNEINRITIIGTFIRRISSGRLKPEMNSRQPFQILEGLKPVSMDDPETLIAQETMLSIARSVACCLISAAGKRYQGDLRPHQEVAGILSDMIIEIYACESAYLRAYKLAANKKEPNQMPALLIAKVLSVRLFDTLRSLTARILPAIIDSGEFSKRLALIYSLLMPPSIDTIAMNRRIAEFCVKKKGYPFKIM
jgi:alkylation response protein AidB-like acyl-CoA dehydrogenase